MTHSYQDELEFGYRTKTLKVYLIGLFGSLLLTIAAFGAVYEKLWNDSTLYILVSALAVVQLIVQSICFLRLNATPAGRWNLFPFLFVLMIIAFLVGGSLWIMYNLNFNMVG